MNILLTMKAKIIIAFVCSVTYANAQRVNSPSVQFFSGSYKQLLAESKRFNKPIFIDVSTSWCKPCKIMKKEAFSNDSIVKPLNSKFLNYSVDAEKGEGKVIASKYNIIEYPTILFIMQDEVLIHKVVGYNGVKSLVEEIGKSFTYSDGPNSLYRMKKDYAQGVRSKSFLKEYIKKLDSLGLSTDQILNTYVSTLNGNDLRSKDICDFLSESLTSTQTKGYRMLVSCVKDSKDSAFVAKVINRLNYCINVDINDIINHPNETNFKVFLKNVKEVFSLDPNYDQKKFSIHAENYGRFYYSKSKNLEKYRPLAVRFSKRLMSTTDKELEAEDQSGYENFLSRIEVLPDSAKMIILKEYGESKKHISSSFLANDLYEIANVFLSNKSKKSDLILARVWIRRAIDIKHSSLFYKANALIDYKLGNLKSAIILKEKAISLASKEGKDMRDFEEDLIKIKSRTL